MQSFVFQERFSLTTKRYSTEHDYIICFRLYEQPI